MAIHDAGMFTVKKTNRLKILQDVIDRKVVTTRSGLESVGLRNPR